MGTPETNEKKVADFLRTLTRSGGLKLNYKIACNGQSGPPASLLAGVEVQPGSPADSSAGVEVQPNISQATDMEVPAPNPSETLSSVPAPEITVEFSGPDVPMLLARNGELLLALEHVAAKILRFEHEDHDRISFDANNFKLLRHQELRIAAQVAVERVRRTGQPFSFAPMSSRERRILHLELANSGLQTASSGEGPRRFVVLYPEGAKTPPVSTEERTKQIRSTFRRR